MSKLVDGMKLTSSKSKSQSQSEMVMRSGNSARWRRAQSADSTVAGRVAQAGAEKEPVAGAATISASM